ncbi:MAG: DJ-1/PfpI family protein [Pseudomonadota bacterium]
MNEPVKKGIGTLLCVLSLLSGVTTRASELVLDRAQPSRDSTLLKSPRSVRLFFSQLPSVADAALSIVATGGDKSFAVTSVHTMGENDLMGFVEGTLPDGEYQLRWRTAGEEGNSVSGVVPFRVKRAAGQRDDQWEPPLDIGIVLYPGAEPLDVFGPLEMWMNAGPDRVRVHLIAEQPGPVILTTTSYPPELAPQVVAPYSFEDAPALDVLMVPGGLGTMAEVDNPAMIRFLKDRVPTVAVATSVCTGSALYAKAGVLEGVKATGNKVFFDYLVSQGSADWVEEARWVESGRFFTSSGVSAGIDMSLAVLARFFGVEGARMVAASAEYDWQEDASRDPFVRYLNAGMPYVPALQERARELKEAEE